MADREKKRGGRKYKNLNIYLKNEKSFLDEIKSFFIVFKELSFDEK